MAFEFKMNKMVEFADTDLAGIMHFSRYFVYMEQVEHAFFRSLGLTIHDTSQEKTFGWPRVDVACNYKSPLRFEDEIEIHLIVKEKKAKTLSYQFTFFKITEDGLVVTSVGTFKTVYVSLDKITGQFKSTVISELINNKIEQAPLAFIK